MEQKFYTGFWVIKIQKEVKSHQKQPSCEKGCSLAWRKSCEIKGSGQEMAAMILVAII